MKTIDRKELKAKLDRGDDFKLVMTLGEWAYNAKHIPGSLNISSYKDMQGLLNPDDEIVVYCSHELCIASQTAYRMLDAAGYSNVRRYMGGLEDWENAGYPLEGSFV